MRIEISQVSNYKMSITLLIFQKCHGAVKNFPPTNLTKISEPKVIIIEKLVTLQPNPHKNNKRRTARKAQRYRME